MTKKLEDKLQKKPRTSKNLSTRTLIGMGFIVFAVMLFFNNIGFKLLGIFFSNWPFILIVVGAAMIVYQKQTPGAAKKPLPYFLIGVGVLFALTKYGIFNFSIGALIAPLILLAVGFHLLRPDHNKQCKNWFAKSDNFTFWKSEESSMEADMEMDNIPEENKIDVFTILGGGDYATRSQTLSKGSVITVLGGAEVDIREADCEGNTIEIDVLSFMGGVNIMVPPHWQVTSKVLPFLGGVSNKTTCLADKLGVPRKQVIITGFAFLGGVDIRN
ncbi:LiaF transmembrane domain-containing protein [Teredinibacter franksiae]|jgi:Predicted membrane protein (DUF2154).|uniref:LiaF transmembrane domain-containing protein n=1 Tax=Teredinibacter franksiae TaxID=2761453 RepID=UPI0016279B71|nr:LiaF domain-containing protein [Teredinibacter franksiae]